MANALIVVDAQKIYTDPNGDLFCEDANSTIERVNKLISHFKSRQEPVILVRHVHRRDGSDLGRMFDFTGEPEEDFTFKEGSTEIEYDDRLIRPEDAVEVIKTRYSAFAGTDLSQHLQRLGISTIVVCGFMTNFCCESTARDAHDRDYFVDFIVDATGTPGTESYSEEEIRTIVGELLEEGFARVASAEDYLGSGA